MSNIEQDTRFIVNNNLINKGWILDIQDPNKNVFFESDILRIVNNEFLKKSKKRPDYVLFDSQNKRPIGVIETKSGGKSLTKALDQATEYAEMLDAPLIFAMNNGFCETRHLYTQKPLFIDENEVNELIRVNEAKEFILQETNGIYITPKEILVSRKELINVFKKLNNSLRGEGLRAGIERLSEFANILFLKLYTENANTGIWNSLKSLDNDLLINTTNNILQDIDRQYGASVFTNLQLTNPVAVKEMIKELDKLKLSSIDTDIKGDAFEYFLQQATATNNDLGEYFTPRHITKTIVNLVNPKYGEKIYDPFCGTGGFLTEAFDHIKDNTLIANNSSEEIKLKHNTIFGREITSNAKLAKMNMILHGDGHSGICQIDTLQNPIESEYDVVITNMPFSQKTSYSHLYENKLAKNDGDGVCVLHCFKATKKGGRMALVVPEGFLFKAALAPVRKYLFENAQLKAVVSLPKEVFLPYAKVKTNILYFTNCHNGRTNSDVFYYNVTNDGLSLDSFRRKIDENDLKNLDFADLNKSDFDKYYNELGFLKVNPELIRSNDYIYNYAHYSNSHIKSKFPTIKLKELLSLSGKVKVGEDTNIPIMSITMEHGLIDQHEKFKKRVASSDISGYKKVFKNELVMGFPIDEGVLGFQKYYDAAAVSPAYKIFRLKREVNVEYLDLILRSNSLRKIYKSKMQGSVERRR
ncbi:TPA: N-6 DNA methylase, partial [Acinetobacter baumannii]